MKNWRTECPLLLAFITGAIDGNSGIGTYEGTPNATPLELSQAEKELMALLGENLPATAQQLERATWLGEQADNGYTLHGQTAQWRGTEPDDEQHVLMCYTILDREY